MKGTTARSQRRGQSAPKEVRSYLAALPVEVRRALLRIREAIRAAAPRAEEGFSYGVPGFKLEGRMFIWYGAAKHHCSLYTGSAAIREHAAALRPYDTSKGTIRFSPEKPVPSALVHKLVRTRIKELRNPKA